MKNKNQLVFTTQMKIDNLKTSMKKIEHEILSTAPNGIKWIFSQYLNMKKTLEDLQNID